MAEVLLLRCDADARLGTGHVMRCLALAQAWREIGGQAHFVVQYLPETLSNRLAAESISVHHLDESKSDAVQTIGVAKDIGAGWVVLDGYEFNQELARVIKEAGFRLLVVDDFGGGPAMIADLVLNHNAYASQAIYAKRKAGTALLLGSGYALLREEFRKVTRNESIQPNEVRRVLITIGGSDPENVSRLLIEVLTQMTESVTARLVVGPGNPRAEELQAAAGASCGRVEVYANPRNLPELMAWAEVAISAAGTTCSELAYFGVPMLLLVTAENQAAVAEKLSELGVAQNLGWHGKLDAVAVADKLSKLLADKELRKSMSKKGRSLVDGRGAQRVVTEMRSHLFSLREARKEDCDLLLAWANEPAARAASFSSAEITRQQHAEWLEQKLDDRTCNLSIAVDQRQRPIGQVRFDRDKEGAVISVSIDRDRRGRGIGAAVIRRAACEYLRGHPERKVSAYIRPDNAASQRAFLKAGFSETASTLVRGQSALRLVLGREDCAQ